MTRQRCDDAEAWDRLRRQYWAFFLIFGAGFVALGIASSRIGHIPLWAYLVWWIGFPIVGPRWGAFVCPRCRKPFFKASAWAYNPYGHRCPHCGLEKWADRDETMA